MNGYGSDACQCFDVLAEQGRASIFIDGEAGHAVNVLNVGNMQLADFFDPHAGIKRNPRSPELGRLSFRSFQITGSVTEERVQFGFSYHPENDGFQFSQERTQVIRHSYSKIPDTAMMRKVGLVLRKVLGVRSCSGANQRL